MKNDPFTITVALSSTSPEETKAFGELYLDDGETYAHTRGELIWRGFAVTRRAGKTRSSPKVLTLKSRDLVVPALAKGEPIVETTNSFTAPSILKAGEYDAEGNAFAKSIADVVDVERIVILGLERRPSSVRVGDRELEFTYSDGASAEEARKESGKAVASKLIIKKPNVSIVKDWDVIISL
jgi:alpha 1,3-glucosidase